jgi:putative addiction module killer protein
MKIIRSSDVFEKWLKKLKDVTAKAMIRRRINRLADGNPGDCRFLGDISELRIDYGPGYRVYFWDTGKEIIVLLCGGDKSTQQADIANARKIACDFEKEE